MGLKTSDHRHDNYFPEVEDRLRPLATPLLPVRPGDWLDRHREKGQTFRQYLSADPVRRDDELTTIYLCLLGGFAGPQERILDLTREYLGIFFDVPVVVQRRVPLSAVPAYARRRHPEQGVKQFLTGFILHDLLMPDRPDDALAYLALTAADLWPGEGWSFVVGEALLRQRVGVWSICRVGWPGDDAAFHLCLRRTLSVASHEAGHVLTMQHCTAHRCLMNGFNHLDELDGRPLHPCPVCLRKLMWNLQVEPVAYLTRLAEFYDRYGIREADWCREAVETLVAK